MMNSYINKYQDLIHPVMADVSDGEMSHMIHNKAFTLAEELNAKYKHKIMGYVPMGMSWGNDNPRIGTSENSMYRAIVMEAGNNLPSYYIYYYDDVYGICSPKNIKERGNRHVTVSKKLSSLMKAIKDRGAIPENIFTDIFKRDDGWAIKNKYIKHVVDVDNIMSELNNISLRGSVLGVILQKAKGMNVDTSGQIQKTIDETLDKILQREQDIESGIRDKLCVFDKPIKVLGYMKHLNMYYEYDMKIDNAVNGNESTMKMLSDIKVSNIIEKLPSYDSLKGLLTMWKVVLPEFARKDNLTIRNDYFVDSNWGNSNNYNEDLGILTNEIRDNSLGYSELAFFNLE